MGEALKCCIAFERADWENVKFQNLDAQIIQKAYFDAVVWSNNAVSLVSK